MCSTWKRYRHNVNCKSNRRKEYLQHHIEYIVGFPKIFKGLLGFIKDFVGSVNISIKIFEDH